MYYPYRATRPAGSSAPQPNYQQGYVTVQPVSRPAQMAQAESLGALPTSHGELRQRLEMAGVPADQVAAVLLEPAPAAEPPIPTLPPRPLQLQQSQPQQPPPYQVQPDGFAVQPSQLSNLVFYVHNSPIEENFRANHQDYCTHVLVPPGVSHNHPSYSTVFSTESNYHKEPHLRIYRNVGNNIDKSARREVGSCLYHHEWSEKIEIRHPWMVWDKWEPELGYWTSDVGTIQGATMRWQYGWKDPQDPSSFIIRNATIDGLEVCRVTLLGEDSARIQLANYAFEGCTDEQRDEMISNALIQMFRKWVGWTSEKMQHTKDARRGKGPSAAAVTAGRIARMNASMMAAGGGGGGC